MTRNCRLSFHFPFQRLSVFFQLNFNLLAFSWLSAFERERTTWGVVILLTLQLLDGHWPRKTDRDSYVLLGCVNTPENFTPMLSFRIRKNKKIELKVVSLTLSFGIRNSIKILKWIFPNVHITLRYEFKKFFLLCKTHLMPQYHFRSHQCKYQFFLKSQNTTHALHENLIGTKHNNTILGSGWPQRRQVHIIPVAPSSKPRIVLNMSKSSRMNTTKTSSYYSSGSFKKNPNCTEHEQVIQDEHNEDKFILF